MSHSGSQYREHPLSLWWLTVSPTVWALHFLLSYTTAAIWCARIVERDADLGGARLAVGAYTAVALLAIGVVTLHAWRRHRRGGEPAPHEYDTPGDRHRFLGLAMLLLSLLSLVAVLYVAAAALVLGTCR